MAILEREVNAARDLETLLFPSAEPWLLTEESRAAARRSCLACFESSVMAPQEAQEWLGAELSKIAQDIPGPMSDLISARALKYGRPSALWLQKSGSSKKFLDAQQSYLESAQFMQSSVVAKNSEGLDPARLDWFAPVAAWSSAMAGGPMLGEEESKIIFWTEVSDFKKSHLGAGRAAFLQEWTDASPSTGSAPSRAERALDVASSAYFVMGDLPSKGSGGLAEQKAAAAISEILYPSHERWHLNPMARSACESISALLARAAIMEAADPSEESKSAATHLITHGMASVKRSFFLAGGDPILPWVDLALERSQRMGPAVATWVCSGASIEKFIGMQARAEALMSDQARQWLPTLVSAIPSQMASHGACRDWCIRQAARAKALSEGPFAGVVSAHNILWAEFLRPPAPSDEPSRSEYSAALQADPGAPGAPSSSIKALREVAANQLSMVSHQGLLSRLSESAASGFSYFAQQFVDVLDGTTVRSLARSIKSLIRDDKRTAGDLASEIQKRFGFEAVQVDGLDPAGVVRALRSAQLALAASAERLGVLDEELGRKGRSTLTLSGIEASRRGAGGYCDTDSGNITLAVPIHVSTIVHEWAHSLDGLAGRAMGVQMKATEYLQNTATDHPAAQALDDIARAIRARPEMDRAHILQEQSRLGRVCAAKIAIQTLGREAWSVLPRAQRDQYLDKAQQAAFGIVCYQARMITKNRKDMESAPKDRLKGLESEAGRMFAERLEWIAGKAVEPDFGGHLGKNARAIADILHADYGADPSKAVGIAVRQANADGLRLGLQALTVGEPVFDRDAVASIRPKQNTAFDVACSVMNALFFQRPSSAPSKNIPLFPPGYYSQPWEVLARSTERFTASGGSDQFQRAIRLALSPTTQEDALLFRQGWSKLLDVAGIQARPEGMKLAGGTCMPGVDACFAALGAPLRAVLKVVGSMKDKLAERRAAHCLSDPEDKILTTTRTKVPS